MNKEPIRSLDGNPGTFLALYFARTERSADSTDTELPTCAQINALRYSTDQYGTELQNHMKCIAGKLDSNPVQKEHEHTPFTLLNLFFTDSNGIK